MTHALRCYCFCADRSGISPYSAQLTKYGERVTAETPRTAMALKEDVARMREN